MIRIVAGYDEREAIGWHVFASSMLRRSSMPISITPLHLSNLAGYTEKHKDGTNAFIYSRFLVPWLMDYSGFALFVDGADMLCRGDIAELWALRDPMKAVQVVQHRYETKSPRKYLGTEMEADNYDYPRKNWSSLMLINCAHYNWRRINPDTVRAMNGPQLHRLSFIEDRFVGELPPQWNWLAGEYAKNATAKLVHFTLGIPFFEHYRDCDYSDEWFDELEFATNQRRVQETARVDAC
jgi:hypothetical protein